MAQSAGLVTLKVVEVDGSEVVKPVTETVMLFGTLSVGRLRVDRLIFVERVLGRTELGIAMPGGLRVGRLRVDRLKLGKLRVDRLRSVWRVLGRTMLGVVMLGRLRVGRLRVGTTVLGTTTPGARMVAPPEPIMSPATKDRISDGMAPTGTTTAVAVATAGFVTKMDCRMLTTAGMAGKGEKRVV